MATPRVLVVLSGCGFLDGSEIHEAVLSLLYLDRAGAQVTCAAPNVPQMHVVDHAAGAPTDESRNVLAESARIARGEIVDLARILADNFDALVMPGGFGAAKNLSSFATHGKDATVNPQVQAVVRAFREQDKPICAICISPAVVVAALGEGTVTVGDDPGTAGAITAMGGAHENRLVTEICVDEARKIVTTPAYMYHTRIGLVSIGIEAAVARTLAFLPA